MDAGAAGGSKHLADRQRQDRRGADRGLSDLTGLDVQRKTCGVRDMDDANHLLRRGISRDRDRAFTDRFALLKKIIFLKIPLSNLFKRCISITC